MSSSLVILFVFALLGLFLYFAVSLFSPAKIRNGLLVTFAISLSCVSVCINPDEFWDLYRHYELLEEIKNSGLSFADFVFDNPLKVGGSDYSYLVVFNIIRYFVVWTGVHRLLPFVMVFAVYGIWIWIAQDWSKKHKISGHLLIVATFVCMIFMPFIFVNSGLRNTTAASIVSLAVYLNLENRVRLWGALLLFSAAFLIHAGAIIFVIPFLLTKIKFSRFGVIFLVALAFVLPELVRPFVDSEYEVLRKIASSFYIYTEEREFSLNWYLIATLLMILPIIFLFLKGSKKGSSITSFEENLITYSIYVILFSLLNFGHVTMMLRTMYSLGVLSVPITSICLSSTSAFGRRCFAFWSIVSYLFVARAEIVEYVFSSWF